MQPHGGTVELALDLIPEVKHATAICASHTAVGSLAGWKGDTREVVL